MVKLLRLEFFLLLFIVPALCLENEDKPGEALQKAIVFFEDDISDWNSRNRCVSCHNELPVIWSLEQAGSQGYAVDMEKRRPRRSKTETSGWSALAIGEEYPEAKSKFLQLSNDDSENSLEASIILFLLNDQRDSGQLVTALKSAQNSDGGWGWQPGAASDPISTGQVLFAVRDIAVPGTMRSSARQYLLSQQEENGSWHSKMNIRGWTEANTEASVYWATAWGILGLSYLDAVVLPGS